MYINPAPIRCNNPNIFSALKKRSAIKPMIKGAMMAPHDCVEKTLAISKPLALRLVPKKVPRVTNHPPQMKNSKNIMRDNWIRVPDFICVRYYDFLEKI